MLPREIAGPRAARARGIPEGGGPHRDQVLDAVPNRPAALGVPTQQVGAGQRVDLVRAQAVEPAGHQLKVAGRPPPSRPACGDHERVARNALIHPPRLEVPGRLPKAGGQTGRVTEPEPAETGISAVHSRVQPRRGVALIGRPA